MIIIEQIKSTLTVPFNWTQSWSICMEVWTYCIDSRSTLPCKMIALCTHLHSAVSLHFFLTSYSRNQGVKTDYKGGCRYKLLLLYNSGEWSQTVGYEIKEWAGYKNQFILCNLIIKSSHEHIIRQIKSMQQYYSWIQGWCSKSTEEGYGQHDP